MTDGFKIIAHRGASASRPENTLSSFECALEQGAREIELDVRFSSDEEIVVFHDDQLDKKTALTGRVRHYPVQVLEQVDLLPWFQGKSGREPSQSLEEKADTCIPTLKKVFQKFENSVHYHIELKGWDDRLPLLTLRVIDAFELQEHVTLTSFSKRPLVEIRKLNSEIPITFLLRDASDAITSHEFRPELEGLTLSEIHDYWLQMAANEGFQWVGIRSRDATPESIQTAKALGLEIRGWGVRQADEIDEMMSMGMIGATVDWPGLALKRLRDRLEHQETK
ncbi:MAG: hypothetical protein CMN75_15565 [Spirochaeta sp.]|nr:hypothetical protein [Spirochaeta sp.]RPG07016.1 MAG: hypothetical protein CBC32_010445 [Proteobacteria bacterium TMED72]